MCSAICVKHPAQGSSGLKPNMPHNFVGANKWPRKVTCFPQDYLGHLFAPTLRFVGRRLKLQKQGPPCNGRPLSSRVTSHRVCNPHSVFTEPAHRPARSSSPSETGLVQGKQPILP